jgi:hypothetical protein
MRAEINKIETSRTIQRINETKSWFFVMIHKLEKPLDNMTKWRREMTQINKINDEKDATTTNTNEIQRII